MTTLAVAIICVVVMLLISGTVVLVEVRRRRVFDWQKLPMGGSYILPIGYTGVDIPTALDKAVECLKRETNFPPALYNSTLPFVSIVVMAADKWKNRAGVWVGGETERLGNAYMVRVEKGGSSLCHELAHVMEYAAMNEADYEHASWTDKHIWAADEAYRAWLKEATS